jgi:hypothetical protein
MIFVVHIWKQPAVATVEDADAVSGRLAAHAAAQPEPLLDALQDSLLARYPADIDSRDADPVWLDSLRPPCEPANHLSLGIATARVDEALPFLIDAANRLGLYVYDPQNARVNRPDGVVLGKPMPRAAAATRASGSSARVRAREPEVQRQLLAMLEPVMKRHGFRKARIHHDGVGFKRVAGACQHTIELMVFDESGGVRINALLNSENTDFTAEIHRAVTPAHRTRKYLLEGSLSSYLQATRPDDARRLLLSSGNGMRVVWQDECEAAAGEIIPLFDADLIPLLLRVETPEGYWEVVRAEHLGERPRMLHEDAMCQMLAGRMAGDGLWERLATAEAARLAEQVTAFEQKGDQPVSLDDARRRLDDLQRFEAYLRTA